MVKRKKTILFLARDPGGVQTLLPLLSNLTALKEFKKVILSVPSSAPLYAGAGLKPIIISQEHIDGDFCDTIISNYKPNLVVTGTSVPSPEEKATPEQIFISTAKKNGIYCLSILDSWGRYIDRFSSDGKTLRSEYIPECICVMDDLCKEELIKLGIDKERIIITNNPYFDAVRRKAAVPPAVPAPEILKGAKNIVYASQPIKQYNRNGTYTYTQYTLFNILIEELIRWNPSSAKRVIVWLHPKENEHRWEEQLNRLHLDLSVVLSRKTGDPGGILYYADFLVTSHSTVVYEAVYYGTPCISLQLNHRGKDLLVTNKLGLSLPAYSQEEFHTILHNTDFTAFRGALLQKKDKTSGGFFPDGKATDRVYEIIKRIID